jgi:hypothetical protein
LAFVVVIATLLYGLVSIWAAYLGLDHWLGFWGVVIVIACLFFRVSLPLAVGAFLGAMNVWHWHWALALLFAAPGLAYMIPAVAGGLISALRGTRRSV